MVWCKRKEKTLLDRRKGEMTLRTATVLGGDPSCFSGRLENNRGDHNHDASMLEFHSSVFFVAL